VEEQLLLLPWGYLPEARESVWVGFPFFIDCFLRVLCRRLPYKALTLLGI
jgi:hypothetical protein